MDFTAFLAGASLTAGRIVVLDLNGNIKILAPGQAIAPGELVIETLEETDVPQFRIATDAGETNITDDIQQIFAALEEGQDPTQLGDDFATAAGETGGSSLVAGGTISRIGAESLASTDFSTQGLQALGLNEAQSLSLFDLLNDANTALQDIDSIAPSAPTITLDTDSGSKADDFLTNDGSYTVTDIEDGATVEYFVDGEWTATEPVAVEGENTIIIRQTDDAGNSSESSTLTFTLDTTAPDAPQISLDTDSGSLADDFLTNKGDFTVAGTEEGATVEYFVNGEWTTTAPTPVEGDNTIIVRQTDAAGNTSGSSTLTFTLDTTAQAGTVSVDPITSDDVITETEKNQTITVTGSATGGDIKTGDIVTAIINGNEYKGSVSEDGSWELSVSGSDLAVDTAFEVTVNSTDAAGNKVTSKGESVHRFDDTPINVNIDIDPITSDSVINAQEVNSLVTVTGTVTGESFSSGVVTLTINGVEYTGEVVDGKYSIEVKGSDLSADSDNVVDAKVDVVNTAGNIGSATSTEFYLVDTFARGTIKIDPITDDNVINKAESEGLVKVTGSVGGDARPGDQVTVVVNGVTYTTSVLSNKTWEVSVSGSDLAQDDKVTATVTGDDWAGNPFSGSGERGYLVDLETASENAAPSVLIESGDDNIINAEEAKGGVAVTITLPAGTNPASDTLHLEINGTTVELKLSEQAITDNKVTYTIAEGDIKHGQDIVVKATIEDGAGNLSDEGKDDALVDTQYGEDGDDNGSITQPTVSITDNNDEELINASETATIRGNIGETDAATVDLVISDGDASTEDIVVKGVSVDSDGNFTLEGVDVSSLKDGKLEVTATFTDSDGNVATAKDDVAKDTQYGEDGDDNGSITQPTVSITDNNDEELINASETATIRGNIGETDAATVDLVISDGDASTEDIVVKGVSVDSDGNFTLEGVDVSSLKDGKLEVTATFTDSDGNVATAKDDVAKDTQYGEDGDDNGSITQPTVSITDNNDEELINASETATIRGNIGETDAATVDLVISDGDASTEDIVVKGVSVDSDGNFTLEGVDVSSLKDGKLEVTATFTDSDGNVATAKDDVAKDTQYGEDGDDNGSITQPTVSITDNNDEELINASETATIRGNIGETDAATVDLVISDGDASTEDIVVKGVSVDSDGNFTLEGVDVSSLKDGKLEVTATFTDSDGNVATAKDDVAKDTQYGEDGDDNGSITQPTVSITDNNDEELINASETATIRGNIGETDAATVDLVISDGDASTEDIVVKGVSVDSDGNFTLEGVDVSSLKDGKLEVTATFTDSDGNVATAKDDVAKDTQYGEDGDDNGSITQPTVSITDNNDEELINASETATIRGNIGETDAATVDLVISDGDASTEDIVVKGVSVDSDGNFTLEGVDVSSLKDGKLEVTATFTDSDGNVATAKDDVAKDTQYGEDGDDNGSITQPTVSITDNNDEELINASETATIRGNIGETDAATVDLVISDGDASTEDIVVKGVSVDSDGNFTLEGVDVSSLKDGKLEVTATFTDSDGNVATAKDDVAKDTQYGEDGDDNGSITQPTVSITDNNDEELINASETATIRGNIGETDAATVDLVISDGDASTEDIVVKGVSVDSDGNFTLEGVDVSSLKDGKLEVTATFTDSDGNVATAKDDVAKDTQYGEDGDDNGSITQPTVSITDNNDEELINASETATIRGNIGETDAATVDLVISDGDASTEDIVVKGVSVDSDGNFTLEGVDVSSLKDGKLEVTATFTDSDGNVATAKDDVAKDTQYGEDGDDNGSITQPTVSITDNNDEELINASETATIRGNIGETDAATVDLVISDGDASTEDIVVKGVSVDSDGNFTLEGVDVSSLKDGKLEVTATFTDSDGNVATAKDDVAKDTQYGEDGDDNGSITQPTVSITDNNDEELINASETATIRGNIGETDAATVDLVISDGDASTEDIVVKGVSVDSDGNFTLEGVDVSSLKDGKLEVTATFTDSDGNVATAKDDVAKDTQYGEDGDDNGSITQPTVSITDNNDEELINASETATIRGNIGETDAATVDLVISDGDASTEDIVVKGVSVDSDGNFTLEGVDVSSLKDGKLEVTATFTDSDGNVATAKDDVAKDTQYGEDGDDNGSITQPTVSITDNNDEELINASETATIRGNIGETDAATVDLVISDGDASTEDIVVKGVSVDSDGNFTLEGVDVSSLKDGKLEVTATFTDSDGNVATAKDDVAKDTQYGEDGDDNGSITQPTVSITDNNDEELINASETATIRGNIGETDAATVDLVISDGDASTEDIVVKGVSVDSDGNFTLEGVDVSSLKDGKLEVTATFTDSDGNVATAKDDVQKDTVVSGEVDILSISPDNLINFDESQGSVVITGTAKQDAKPGDLIQFFLGGSLVGEGRVSNEPVTENGKQVGYAFEITVDGKNLVPEKFNGGPQSLELTANLHVEDTAGNKAVSTNTDVYFLDIVAPDAPTITKVTDDSSGSDYSVVTLHGTGSEPGNEVEVFAKDANGVYVTIGTATVQQDLSWTLDISSESAIPVNDNEFLYAKEKDSFGNVSEASDSVHYFHGDYSTVSAESTDDFVLLGSGDDLFKSNQDDANNKLVVDGGAGNDTAELNFASTSASVALNTDGSVTITEANGDVNTFIEFENFKFTDGTKTTSELFAPKVILERDQDDVINSDRSTVGYTITLPVGAVVGAMLTVVIEGVTQSFALEPEHIAAGTISGSIDSGSVVGDELSISAEITYGNQPSHLEFKDSDQLAVNEGPQGNDFVVTLSPDSSVIGFDFETESTVDGQQIDVVTDREDDANSTDAKETTISFDSLPVLGTVYVVNSDGSRTEVTKDTVVKVTDKLEYDLHDDVNDKLSFDAQTDFKGVYADDTVTSFVLDSGVIISGGYYTGSRPDTDSSLTPDELFFDNADNEKGLGVGSSELDVSTKDYISVDFSQISQGKTDVLVKEANVTFGSVWGNYNDTSSADAQIHVLVFKDGQVVHEFIYDDDQQSIYDGSGVFTANIKVDGGFDEIRVYTTHGTDNPNNNGNSNVTLQSVEVVDAAVSEEVVYEATDSDKGTDKGTIDFVTDSTETSTNNAPHLADTRFSEVGTEDTEISLNLGVLNPTDPDGDTVHISNVSVDPSYGSLVLTHDANGVVTSAVFKPAENKHFDDVPFTVTVSDGHKTDTATVMLEVKAVADAPNVTVVFGDSATTNVIISSSLHQKLTSANSGTVFTESDAKELGFTINSVFVANETYRSATGDSNNNLIVGSSSLAGDELIGDSLTSSGFGNDVFVGKQGDDYFVGGTGSIDESVKDTVVYSGNLAEYEITHVGDQTSRLDWIIFDELHRDTPQYGSTGDKLYQIERLIFADAIVTLNPDGTYHVEQITETALNLSASVADRDGSEYLDEVQIKGLPDGTMIIDKDTGETLGGFQNINGEQVWVIDIESNSTQSINYDNLVVRTPSSEALDVDVHVVAKENSLPQSDAGASTEVNAAVSNDVLADQGGEVPTTLISLVIDSSGSMKSKPYQLSDMRIEYVLSASISLLNNVLAQKGSEDVLVQLIDFDSNAKTYGWMSVTQAIDKLSYALDRVDSSDYRGIFDPAGSTDYEDAAEATIDGYGLEPVKSLQGETNDVIYFLSDGENIEGWSSSINTEWDSFIKSKEVIAVGVGNESSVPKQDLQEVAGSEGTIVYIPDSQLETELPKLRPTIGTAGSLLMAVSGDDATEVVIDATKAQVIQMIDTDSSVINMPDSLSFSVDSISNELLVSTLYGDFRIGQDGSYYFQPDSSAPKINTGQSVAFEVLMTVKDVSGVESEQLVTLNVSPNGESNAAATSSFNASTGDDQIRGTDNNDIILGHAGNDVLDGGLGDDLLFGGAGSDLLIGGLGNDILTGGDGADIFKWVDMETARDLVTDFNASQGDKLDLADLFDDMSKADIETLLADLGEGDSKGSVGDVSIEVTNENGAHLTIVKGGQTLTIDFDGASAADITSSLMDNLNHLKD
ncbi:Ig-like domain-containing protein [Vibrio vulnificus]|uniref:Ig-like domain-containing protein n=4 Tax=Vibrio vulnificus TaxID=672 RepID=UPI001419AC1C|nr:Ig-like domain-containing protein [Vibrio vulnificus]NIG90322.1 Ig-like domain-containing protein [Vibrio vulnificus]